MKNNIMTFCAKMWQMFIIHYLQIILKLLLIRFETLLFPKKYIYMFLNNRDLRHSECFQACHCWLENTRNEENNINKDKLSAKYISLKWHKTPRAFSES